MNFETCLSCLKIESVSAVMRRKLMPHVVYKIKEKKVYYSTDQKNWFLFVGSFTAEDVMADDWEMLNILD